MHTAQLMPLPLTVFCFSKIQIGFPFLVPAHQGSPYKEPLNGCVCVCVCVGTEFVARARIAAAWRPRCVLRTAGEKTGCVLRCPRSVKYTAYRS